MKTLSIRQPWSNLILHGIKDIENRTWRTNYRGRILVHAPERVDEGLSFTVSQSTSIYIYGELKPFHTSAILGTVEIVDCVRGSNSIWAETDVWHWVLRDPVLFNEPILGIPGRLSLWDWDGPIPD